MFTLIPLVVIVLQSLILPFRILDAKQMFIIESEKRTYLKLYNLPTFNLPVMRGFMTKHGRPDNPRTARVVLKDYMNGKLLYAHAPPNVSQEEYHKHTLTKV